jgi:hypothetical protein
MMKRSLGQKLFFAIFCTFGRYVTNPRGTFVENVKNVQNQPTLVYSNTRKCLISLTWNPHFSMNLTASAMKVRLKIKNIKYKKMRRFFVKILVQYLFAGLLTSLLYLSPSLSFHPPDKIAHYVWQQTRANKT